MLATNRRSRPSAVLTKHRKDIIIYIRQPQVTPSEGATLSTQASEASERSRHVRTILPSDPEMPHPHRTLVIEGIQAMELDVLVEQLRPETKYVIVTARTEEDGPRPQEPIARFRTRPRCSGVAPQMVELPPGFSAYDHLAVARRHFNATFKGGAILEVVTDRQDKLQRIRIHVDTQFSPNPQPEGLKWEGVSRNLTVAPTPYQDHLAYNPGVAVGLAVEFLRGMGINVDDIIHIVEA